MDNQKSLQGSSFRTRLAPLEVGFQYISGSGLLCQDECGFLTGLGCGDVEAKILFPMENVRKSGYNWAADEGVMTNGKGVNAGTPV